MIRPVDVTTTAAWNELNEFTDNAELDLRRAFVSDPERAARFTHTVGDLHVDLSKNLVNGGVVAALLRLAEQTDVADRRDAVFRDEYINVTKDRAVLHTTLRLPRDTELTVDRQDVAADVHEVLGKMFAFVDKVRSGEQVGVTDKPIRTVVDISIGGSDLGPVMVYEALLPHKQQGLECRFISNINPTDCFIKAANLDPEITLLIVASKTFATLETLTNARMARTWLLDALVARGAIEDTEQVRREAVVKHFVAVPAALNKATEFDIDPVNTFGLWSWVDGRYPMDSVVGLPVAIAIGSDDFRNLLAGFHAVDRHFRVVGPAHNVPLLVGLLNIWYVSFLGATSHAMLPYTQYPHRSAAYLQQLTMEPNGKSVHWDGSPVTCETGKVFWDEPGTSGQHVFYQLIHQGTQLVPVGFITVASPPRAVKDGDVNVHDMFLVNFFTQTVAPTFGKTEEQVREEGTPEEIVPARTFSGNRPTTSILVPTLTPSVVGQLIALYEHIMFVQGIVWGIDSFGQWDVELGKKLALEIAPAVFGDAHALTRQDASTRALVSWYLGNRR